MYNPLHHNFFVGCIHAFSAPGNLSDLLPGEIAFYDVVTNKTVATISSTANEGHDFQVAYKNKDGEIMLGSIVNASHSIAAKSSDFEDMEPYGVSITPTVGVLRTARVTFLVSQPDLPRPYTEYVISSPKVFEAGEGLNDETPVLVYAINKHPFISRICEASVGTGNILDIVEKIPSYSLNQRDRFVRNIFQVSGQTKRLRTATTDLEYDWVADVETVVSHGTYGCGNWQMVADEEKRNQARLGISNFTEFPVVLPKMMTEEMQNYCNLSIQFRTPDRDAANAPITRDINVIIYAYAMDDTTTPATKSPTKGLQLLTILSANMTK